MYAILRQGGHQYRVAPGDRLLVDRLGAEVGSVISLEPVLLVEDGGTATIGTPVVEGARVEARVVAHRQGAKLRVFTYKPKKRHRRTQGHRSRLTELRVEAVLGAAAPPAAGGPAAAARPRRTRTETARVAATTPEAGAAPATTAAAASESTASAPKPSARAPRTRPASTAAPAAEEPVASPSRQPRRSARPAAPTGSEPEAGE